MLCAFYTPANGFTDRQRACFSACKWRVLEGPATAANEVVPSLLDLPIREDLAKCLPHAEVPPLPPGTAAARGATATCRLPCRYSQSVCDRNNGLRTFENKVWDR